MGVWDSVKGFFKEIYDDASYVGSQAGQIKETYDEKFKQYGDMAILVGQKLGFDFEKGGLDDGADAFRHIFASAKSTQEDGASAAYAGGVVHEVANLAEGQPINESRMDLFNNKIGRELGMKAKEEGWGNLRLAQEVKQAINSGKAVISPAQSGGPSLLDYYR